jgi:hypothetical protein
MTKIGGPGRIVCVDETHITRKKKSRSGFRGRATKGHQTIVIAGIELNGEWHERKETGRSFLVIIRDHTGETFRTVLEKHIHEGSIVWTDGHPSYLWLNSDERLGEFMWRNRFLKNKQNSPWRWRAFWQIFKVINTLYKCETEHDDLYDDDGFFDEKYSELKSKYTGAKPKKKHGRKGRKSKNKTVVPLPIADQAYPQDNLGNDLEQLFDSAESTPFLEAFSRLLKKTKR